LYFIPQRHQTNGQRAFEAMTFSADLAQSCNPQVKHCGQVGVVYASSHGPGEGTGAGSQGVVSLVRDLEHALRRGRVLDSSFGCRTALADHVDKRMNLLPRISTVWGERVLNSQLWQDKSLSVLKHLHLHLHT
jgi:hypothetical protein